MDEIEISLDHKTIDKNKNAKITETTKTTTIGFIRRKSCHCQQCGNQTKLEKKHNLVPTKIKFHQITQEKNKTVKKPNKMKVVQDIVSLKRNSMIKNFPKKLSTKNLIKKLLLVFRFSIQY